MGKSRRRSIAAVGCCVLALVAAAGVFAVRTSQVNDELRGYVAERAQREGIQEQPASSQMEIEQRNLGESIDLSFFRDGKRIFPEGVRATLSNPRFFRQRDLMDEYQEWLPMGPSVRESERPQYLLVDFAIDNGSDEEIGLPNFQLKSGVWATVFSPYNLRSFNGIEEGQPVVVAPGETKCLVIPYEIPWNVLENASEGDARQLPLELSLLDYPREIIVSVS